MDWKHFNDNDTNDGVEGRIALKTPEHLVVHIIGTNHGMDWKRNFQLRMVRYDGMRINRHDLYEGQWVVEYIKNHYDLSTIRKITVGGHSRGGATAQVVTAKLLKQHPYIEVECILLAAKRAGNKALIRRIQDCVKAFKHRGDFVPLLPPCIPIFYPYRHFKHTKFGKFSLNIVEIHAVKQFNWVMDKYSLR